MSMTAIIQLPAIRLFAPPHWLGWCWLGVFIGWLVVLMLWIRQLGRYNRAYRKYQQSSREEEKAYSEYQKTYGEPPEDLRLLQKEIQNLHLRLRDIDENPGMTLKLLRRLGLILGQPDIKGDSGEVKAPIMGVRGLYKMGKLLNIPGRRGKEKLLHFGWLILMAGSKRARFVRCHNDDSVKPNCDYTTSRPYIEPFEFGSQTLSCEKVTLICAGLSTPQKGYPAALLGKGC
jgi:hypothetical protein